MIHSLIPWRTLTRDGIPPLKVARRPLTAGEVTVPVGEQFNPELFPHAIRAERLRQFYEQRRLEPVEGTLTLREHYLKQLERRKAQASGETIAPITPVASEIVAGLPTVEAPVEEPRPSPARMPKPKPKGKRHGL
jgi:hypothetical protein